MNLAQIITDLKALWYFDNRWLLLLERTMLKSGNLSIYRIGGMEILMDKAAGDQSGARYVITSNMYRQFLPYMMKRIPTEKLTVLDLGANVGGFPLMLALEGMKFNNVISVELNPNTFLRLRLNLERNLGESAHCVNAGICGEERVITLELGQGSTADNIYGQQFTELLNPHTYTILGRTLDSICAEYLSADTIIDMCKMDIESAEYEVFEKPYHSCLRRCRFMIMELHPRGKHSTDKLLQSLTNLGFQEVPFPDNPFPEVQFFENLAFAQKT